MKQVFVAATRQNDGKTMVSLGLFASIQERLNKIGYMKPVGQQYRLVNNEKIDKDAILFHKAFNLQDPLKMMSPIAVPKGYTESYIKNPDSENLHSKIKRAHEQLRIHKDFLLFEGTGHAGVGSVIDTSNATVANLLGSKVILVSIGGIGKAIDEIMLNKTIFEQAGVEVMGVIINKVLEDKYDKIKTVVTKGLAANGLDVLGVIPLIDQLKTPTIAGLIDQITPELLSGDSGMQNKVDRFVIGDMLPHHALDSLSQNTLMIVPGNREGLILTALCENVVNEQSANQVSGIIFTDGVKPHPKILQLLRQSKIPLLLVEEDTFTIATKINNMILKIRAEDVSKISIAHDIVSQYVDVDQILERSSC